MWTHVGILYPTCSTFSSGNGFMSEAAGLKELPPQLTHWTNPITNLEKKRNYPIHGNP